MKTIQGDLQGQGLKFAIIVSRFNDFITAKLLEGSLDALKRHGVSEADLTIVRVPGAFEIPITAQRLAKKHAKGGLDGIICLGTVIRGATPHFDYVAAEVSKGIAHVMLETGMPISFGVLTTENIEQAVERAGSKSGNKGWDAAVAAIEMAQVLRQI